MNRLISLELRRNSLGIYHMVVLICGVTMLCFQYLLAAVPHLDPAEARDEMFTSYPSLVEMNLIVFMAVFAILSSVMAGRFVVEEYTGKRAILLFSYPVKREKVLKAKISLVFLYTAAVMMVCGIASECVFFLTEAWFPLCSDHLTLGTVLTAFLSLFCHSLLAGMLGILALWFGFGKKSVPVTIVSAVISVSVICQILAAVLFFQPAIIIVLGIFVMVTGIAVKNMISKVERMEV